MSQALSSEAQYVAVTDTSAKFTNPMTPGVLYRLTVNTDTWVKVTATGGTAAADTANNILVLSGQTVLLVNPSASSTTNAFVHVVRNSANGKASLAPLVGMGGA